MRKAQTKEGEEQKNEKSEKDIHKEHELNGVGEMKGDKVEA